MDGAVRTISPHPRRPSPPVTHLHLTSSQSDTQRQLVLDLTLVCQVYSGLGVDVSTAEYVLGPVWGAVEVGGSLVSPKTKIKNVIGGEGFLVGVPFLTNVKRFGRLHESTVDLSPFYKFWCFFRILQ